MQIPVLEIQEAALAEEARCLPGLQAEVARLHVVLEQVKQQQEAAQRLQAEVEQVETVTRQLGDMGELRSKVGAGSGSWCCCWCGCWQWAAWGSWLRVVVLVLVQWGLWGRCGPRGMLMAEG